MDENHVIIRLGHSPDADDAFMWWAITPDVSTRSPMHTDRYRFDVVMDDIESLNHRSLDGDLDITAISCAQYPSVADRYAVTTCGCSFGLQYGPKLVAREELTTEQLRKEGTTIATPGVHTTAALVTALMLDCDLVQYHPVPFDEVARCVAEGEFDAGVVIHEDQLLYGSLGLKLVADTGDWWFSTTQLPLPLGLNVIRSDLDARFGPGTTADVVAILAESIRFGLRHRGEAVRYALQYSRGTPVDVADQFVRLYVNDLTLDFGETGSRAIRRLVSTGAERGLLPAMTDVRILRPCGEYAEPIDSSES